MPRSARSVSKDDVQHLIAASLALKEQYSARMRYMHEKANQCMVGVRDTAMRAVMARRKAEYQREVRRCAAKWRRLDRLLSHGTLNGVLSAEKLRDIAYGDADGETEEDTALHALLEEEPLVVEHPPSDVVVVPMPRSPKNSTAASHSLRRSTATLTASNPRQSRRFFHADDHTAFSPSLAGAVVPHSPVRHHGSSRPHVKSLTTSTSTPPRTPPGTASSTARSDKHSATRQAEAFMAQPAAATTNPNIMKRFLRWVRRRPVPPPVSTKTTPASTPATTPVTSPIAAAKPRPRTLDVLAANTVAEDDRPSPRRTLSKWFTFRKRKALSDTAAMRVLHPTVVMVRSTAPARQGQKLGGSAGI